MPTLTTDHEADPGQLPHTLEVERGIAVRLYLWTYAADPRTINTCKMFWAFVFMAFVLPFSALVHGAAKLFIWIDSKSLDQATGRPHRPYVAPPIKSGPSKGERFLESFSGFMAKIWFKVQPLLKWGGIAIGVLIGAALLYLFATNAVAVGEFLLKVLLIGLGSVAIAAAFVMVCIGLDKLGFFGSIGRKVGGFFRLFRQLGRSVHDHTCANVKIKD